MSLSIDNLVHRLDQNWVWPDLFCDNPGDQAIAGRLVQFTRTFSLDAASELSATIHLSADTRYKLFVNGHRVAIGPTRSCQKQWHFDAIDIVPFLHAGTNTIYIQVLRFFPCSRVAYPFERTILPGLTVVGSVRSSIKTFVTLDTSSEGWTSQVVHTRRFRTDLPDDAFLHIFESWTPRSLSPPVRPRPYHIGTTNGELTPWHLRPRLPAMPVESPLMFSKVRSLEGDISSTDWLLFFNSSHTVTLTAGSQHRIEVEAETHSTAFLRWTFSRPSSDFRMKVSYSEAYEKEPTLVPWLRNKGNRTDPNAGELFGPHDEIVFDEFSPRGPITFEPFWFRTFRFLAIDIEVGEDPIAINFHGRQTNYPLNPKAAFEMQGDSDVAQIWDISVRTLRNCVFDGYSDCPFYEQLQYAEDTRSSGLFHYLLSGDDRLMRQAILAFAASMTTEGLIQSRYPSHVPQIISSFALFWILQICDHMQYFNDAAFVRPLLPMIDSTLEFFASHLNEMGLIAGLPTAHWQFVDWTDQWNATEDYPDGGVSVAGRATSTHSYITMLYSHVLQRATQLLRQVGRLGMAPEYEQRAVAANKAIRQHCYDGRYFLDSTISACKAENFKYSQHCQVWAVICGAAPKDDQARIILDSFIPERTEVTFATCSYVMMHYAFRAFALSGVYNQLFFQSWQPWREMLRLNLSTWEEDTVSHRSDCHAWGSIAIYEYLVEVAGVRPNPSQPGWLGLEFRPRLMLSNQLKAIIALGADNVAFVSWSTKGITTTIQLQLKNPINIISRVPGAERQDHGICSELSWTVTVIQ